LYRKKPVIIEAFQMTRDAFRDRDSWPDWLRRAWDMGYEEAGAFFDSANRFLIIRTLEGRPCFVDWNDYIIQGVRGGIYPCKPDIFEETYEPV
jgi:hypothetical protein